MVIAAGLGGLEFSTFVTFRIESGSVKERQEVVVMPGGSEKLVRQLLGLEVDALLLREAHPDLARALDAEGISLITGVELTPDAAAAAYLAGELFK